MYINKNWFDHFFSKHINRPYGLFVTLFIFLCLFHFTHNKETKKNIFCLSSLTQNLYHFVVVKYTRWFSLKIRQKRLLVFPCECSAQNANTTKNKNWKGNTKTTKTRKKSKWCNDALRQNENKKKSTKYYVICWKEQN